MYSLDHGQIPCGQLLKDIWVLFTYTSTRCPQLWRALSQFLRFLFNDYPSRLLHVGVEVGQGLSQKPSMPLLLNWVCVHQNHDKSSFLTLWSMWEHGSWAYTWFVATAQTEDIPMVSNASTCHRPQSMGSSGSTDHEYHMAFCRCMGHGPYYR